MIFITDPCGNSDTLDFNGLSKVPTGDFSFLLSLCNVVRIPLSEFPGLTNQYGGGGSITEVCEKFMPFMSMIARPMSSRHVHDGRLNPY